MTFSCNCSGTGFGRAIDTELCTNPEPDAVEDAQTQAPKESEPKKEFTATSQFLTLLVTIMFLCVVIMVALAFAWRSRSSPQALPSTISTILESGAVYGWCGGTA